MKKLILFFVLIPLFATAQIDIVKRKVTTQYIAGKNDTIWVASVLKYNGNYYSIFSTDTNSVPTIGWVLRNMSGSQDSTFKKIQVDTIYSLNDISFFNTNIKDVNKVTGDTANFTTYLNIGALVGDLQSVLNNGSIATSIDSFSVESGFIRLNVPSYTSEFFFRGDRVGLYGEENLSFGTYNASTTIDFFVGSSLTPVFTIDENGAQITFPDSVGEAYRARFADRVDSLYTTESGEDISAPLRLWTHNGYWTNDAAEYTSTNNDIFFLKKPLALGGQKIYSYLDTDPGIEVYDDSNFGELKLDQGMKLTWGDNSYIYSSSEYLIFGSDYMELNPTNYFWVFGNSKFQDTWVNTGYKLNFGDESSEIAIYNSGSSGSGTSFDMNSNDFRFYDLSGSTEYIQFDFNTPYVYFNLPGSYGGNSEYVDITGYVISKSTTGSGDYIDFDNTSNYIEFGANNGFDFIVSGTELFINADSSYFGNRLSLGEGLTVKGHSEMQSVYSTSLQIEDTIKFDEGGLIYDDGTFINIDGSSKLNVKDNAYFRDTTYIHSLSIGQTTSPGTARLAVSGNISATRIDITGLFSTSTAAACKFNKIQPYLSTGSLTLETNTPASYDVVINNGGAVQIGSGLKTRSYSETVLDEGSITPPTAMSGWLTVSCFNSGALDEWGMVMFSSDGTVTLMSGSTDFATTDTDNKLCVFDGGSGIVIKNRTGNSAEVKCEIKY